MSDYYLVKVGDRWGVARGRYDSMEFAGIEQYTNSWFRRQRTPEVYHWWSSDACIIQYALTTEREATALYNSLVEEKRKEAGEVDALKNLTIIKTTATGEAP